MARKKIPLEIEETVLVLSRRRCCICYGLNRDTEIKSGQIAHLDGNSNNNILDNLAFLCLEHHDQYDSKTSQSKGLTTREVRRFRLELHEIIDSAWKKPIDVGSVTVQNNSKISGHYVREDEISSAELQIWELLNGNIRVTGIALWGTDREYGPNIGELDFETVLNDDIAVYTDPTVHEEEYNLEINFKPNGLTAYEEYVIGYFGMNVSFEGEYKKIY